MQHRSGRRFSAIVLSIALASTLLASSFAARCCAAQAASTRTHPRKTPVFGFTVVHTYSHDANAFTQGLVYHDGFLYEGTGLKGRSTLRKVRIETGEVLQQTDIAPDLFGEGITIFKNLIIQLTWQSNLGFVYSLADFRKVRQFSYRGEGWGLTTDGRDLFMSDGTAEIRVWDPASFQEKRRVTVHDGSQRIDQLNELEFVEGEIFANVWQTDRIARISPLTGEVLGWIDLKGLLSPMYRVAPGAVLNGIAYDPVRKRLFVTGKLWPNIFEIKLVAKQ